MRTSKEVKGLSLDCNTPIFNTSHILAPIRSKDVTSLDVEICVQHIGTFEDIFNDVILRFRLDHGCSLRRWVLFE